MAKADGDPTFNESLVAAYYEGEIRRVWPAIKQLIELCPEGCDANSRQELKAAAEQLWVRFLNVLRKNDEYRHVFTNVLRKLHFEETMPYKKIRSDNGDDPLP